MLVLKSFARLKGKTMIAANSDQPLADEIVNRVKTGFGISMGN
jgi:hypothetical protein